MHKQQNVQLSMHLNSQMVLNENAGKLETITAYQALKARIDESIADEQSLANSQESRKRNSTAAKIYARTTAVDYVLDLSRKVSAYAIITGNRTLLDKARYNSTTLTRSSDNKLVLIFETMLSLAGDNLQNVLEFGVTEQSLSAGAGLLGNLKSEMQNLLLSNSEQKQLTVQLEKQFRNTNDRLVTLDAMVETMGQSDPVFHRLYRNARRKKRTTSSKLSARGKVFDAVTGLPLPKAKISIVGYNSSKALTSGTELVKNVKIAGAIGGFQLKSLATGTYLFGVSYAGYAEQEVTVHINEGVLTRVEIPLTKLEPGTVQ